jgi:hypothetical protein
MSLLELALENVALVSGVIGVSYITKRFKAKPKLYDPKDNTMAWSWTVGKTCQGFACIKCNGFGKNDVQTPICSCEEYIKEHFHFECNDFHYKSIMRTADDK